MKKKGPVLKVPPEYTRHVRDPKVWESKVDNCWYLILGAQSVDCKATLLLYRSINLISWYFVGEPFFKKNINNNMRGFMWECPDYFDLGGKNVLLLSKQSRCIYHDKLVERNVSLYSQKVNRINDAKSPYNPSNFLKLDSGFEFYAPQTFLVKDGRRILLAWIGKMSEQYENSFPTRRLGWLHVLSVARELSFFNGKLYQYPVREINNLHLSKREFKNTKYWSFVQSEYEKNVSLDIFIDFKELNSFSIRIKKMF